MKICKRMLSLIIALTFIAGTIILTGPAATAEADTVLYVATDGSDTDGTGTQDAPYATLECAFRAISRLRAAGDEALKNGVTVYVRGGRYHVGNTVTLGEEVSGPDCPVTVCAYENEEVIFDSGVTLDNAAFQSLSGAIANRIPAAARRYVKQINLNNYGVQGIAEAHNGKNNVIELTIGNKLMTQARFPTDDFLSFGDKPEGEDKRFDNKGEWPKIASLDGVLIHGYLDVDYFAGDLGVTDISGNTVTVSSGGFKTGCHYYIYNAPEFLDAPGEYYIDTATGMLYVYVTDDFADAHISVTQGDEPVLRVNADNVTVKGITFEGSKGNGVELTGNDITFYGNTIRCVGGIAATMKGLRNNFEHCVVDNIGGAGVSFSGGSFEKGITSDSFVQNNKITNYAKHGFTYCAGVSMDESSLQLTIRNNEIAYSIHNGILGGCYNACIEYNYLHDLCTEASDAGALYTGGWHSQNMTIRYNLAKNIRNHYFWALPSAFYVDDGGSNKIFYGNIVDGVDGYAFLIGAGHNITIYNNLSLNCNWSPVNYDERQYYGRGQYNATKFPGNNFGLIESPQFASESFVLMYMRFTYMRYTNEFDVNDRYAHGAVGYSRLIGNIGHSLHPDVTDDDIDDLTKKFLIDVDTPLFKDINEIKVDENYQIAEDSVVYDLIPSWKNIDTSKIGTIGW